MLEKLTCGVLHVSGAAGLRFVALTFRERIYLLWLFRNFKILQKHVLPERQQRWLDTLCEGRLNGYASTIDREIACVIGTIIIAEPSARAIHEERRMAPRLPLPFEVRYGVGPEMTYGEGCDLSETGIGFEGPRMFTPGTEITVHYRLGSNGRDSWTRTRGIVRNCEGKHMGVEFCIIHPRDRVQLRELTRPPVQCVPTAPKSPVESESGDGLECDPVAQHSGSGAQ